MRIYIMFLLFAFSMMGVFADEYITLDETEKYSYSGGQYHRSCGANGYCEFILNVTKLTNATNHTIAFSAHVQNQTNTSHWYYVPFEQYISSFQMYKNVTTVHGNGSVTTTWTLIDSEQSRLDIDTLSADTTTQRKYTFYANGTVDVIPTYFITGSEYRTYSEYVVFLASDYDGSFIVYFPFDTEGSAPVPNEAIDAQGTWLMPSAMTYPTDGISINGSAKYQANYANTTPYMQDQTFVPSSIWANDSMSISVLGKKWNCVHASTCNIISFVHNNPYIQWWYMTNTSLALAMRDSDGSTDVTTYLGAYDMSKDVWNLLSLSLFDEGAGNLRVKVMVNGTVIKEYVQAGMDGLFTAMTACTLAEGHCRFNSGSGNSINGHFDEWRMYTDGKSPAFYTSLFQSYVTPDTAPTINETLQNTSYAHRIAPYFFTQNISSENFFSVSVNGTGMNATANNAYDIITYSLDDMHVGTFDYLITINNSAGSVYNVVRYTVTPTAPSFTETIGQQSRERYVNHTILLNFSSVHEASLTSSSTSVTPTIDNTTKTAILLFNASTQGSFNVTLNLTDTDGYDEMNFMYMVTAIPQQNQTNQTVTNIVVDLSKPTHVLMMMFLLLLIAASYVSGSRPLQFGAGIFSFLYCVQRYGVTGDRIDIFMGIMALFFIAYVFSKD